MHLILIWSVNMKAKTLLFILVSTVLLTSCSKKITTRRYYVLELTNTSQPIKADSAMFDVQVDIRDFRVARAFDQTRIALRTNTNELDYYFYHHWAAKPGQAVADFVYDLIEDKKLFSQISRGISYNPDYLIVGDIKSLERIQERKEAFAHVHLVMELINANTDEVMARFEDDQRLPVEPAKSMNSFARITSQILRHATNEFLDQVQYFLEEQAKVRQ
jgi:ABC-type uncharacterized transport system auxiliary subunit